MSEPDNQARAEAWLRKELLRGGEDWDRPLLVASLKALLDERDKARPCDGKCQDCDDHRWQRESKAGARVRELKAEVFAARDRANAATLKVRALTLEVGALKKQISTMVQQDLDALPTTEGSAATPEPTYPCVKCGVLRTKAEGGTTFTVCDACWDSEHPEGDGPK